ncbi:MAG TPA: GNAT family N-acetyltransferase, partial [Chloroflexia bacterium]
MSRLVLRDITIRPLHQEELELLGQMNRDWDKGRPLALHVERLAMQQEGKAVYLFAWHQERPVGHVLLMLTGPSKEPMRSALRNCAHISDLFVVPDCWSQGIGTRLMDEAEALAAHHGSVQVGLDVAIDNDRAMTMYERRGYIDMGFGERAVSWTYIDPEGQQQVQNDVLVYLVKLLS